MMLCPNCGAENHPDDRFCTKCGAVLSNGEERPDAAQTSDDARPAPPLPKRKTKKLPVILAIVLAAVVAAAALLYFLVLRGETAEYDLSRYVTVTYEGADGSAAAWVSLDRDALARRLAEDRNLPPPEEGGQAPKQLTNALEALRSAAALVDMGEYLTDYYRGAGDQGLTNGDTFTVRLFYDNTLAQADRVRFTGGDLSVTVSGLEPAPSRDPFEGLEVSFTGLSGSARLEMDYHGPVETLRWVAFTADKADWISNGDVITVSLVDTPEEFAARYGFVPRTTEKQFTVSGLTAQLTDPDQLSGEMEAMLQGKARELFAGLRTPADPAVTWTQPELVGCALMYGGASGDAGNTLTMLYRSFVSSDSGAFIDTYLYYPVEFSNVTDRADDTVPVFGPFLYDSTRLNGESVDGTPDPWVYCDAFRQLADDRGWQTAFTGQMAMYAGADGGKITKLAELDSAALESLCAYGAQCVERDFLADQEQSRTVLSVEHLGQYLIVEDEALALEGGNCLLLLYRLVCDGQDGENEVLYIPYRLEGLVKLDGGFHVTLERGVMRNQQGQIGYDNLAYVHAVITSSLARSYGPVECSDGINALIGG